MKKPRLRESEDDPDALEQELLNGLDTAAREMTKEDWDTLRRRVWERHEAAHGHE